MKPENIVRVGKKLKLIDFGLSRKGDGRSEMSSYMVTRWFRAPELLRVCEDFHHIHYDGRVDMWSLALTAYFIQNNDPLFYGTCEQILSQYAKYRKKAKEFFTTFCVNTKIGGRQKKSRVTTYLSYQVA